VLKLKGHQVGVHPVPLLGGIDTASYEHLAKATLAQLPVYMVLWSAPNLDLQAFQINIKA
jgi:hypothetical protein